MTRCNQVALGGGMARASARGRRVEEVAVARETMDVVEPAGIVVPWDITRRSASIRRMASLQVVGVANRLDDGDCRQKAGRLRSRREEAEEQEGGVQVRSRRLLARRRPAL